MEPTFSVSVHTDDGTNPLGSVVVVASERISYLYQKLYRINHTAKKRLLGCEMVYNGQVLGRDDTFLEHSITEDGSIIIARKQS